VTRANKGSIETLFSLAASRTPAVTREQIELFVNTNDAKAVAEKIDWLETLPVATRSQVQDRPARQEGEAKRLGFSNVPEGRYAVRNAEGVVKFYKVDRPTEGRWAGYVFVKVQASDDLYPVKGKGPREAVLAAIAEAGVEASMTLYGRELGKCGHCGRTLTDEDSRARGIGPVCYGKMGF
jgi:hypothetical protein